MCLICLVRIRAIYCIYQRLQNKAIQFLQVQSNHSYEYGWGCRQQGLCATHQTLLEQAEWKRLRQNYFGPWPATGAANLRKQSTARRLVPWVPWMGWGWGCGKQVQVTRGDTCAQDRTGLPWSWMHQHWAPQSRKGKHSPSWTHSLPPSLPPHFSHSLWCSPSSFSLQVVSKDLLTHSPLSPPPFLPGRQCQHISTSPSWPHKCHNTVSFRFSHSPRQFLPSTSLGKVTQDHVMPSREHLLRGKHCLPFQVVSVLQHREFNLTKGTVPSPPLCCTSPPLQEQTPLILASRLLKLG